MKDSLDSKRQLAAIIISVILGLILYLNFWFGGTMSYYDQSMINVPVTIGILICFILGYKIPAQKTMNAFDYWFVIFPLAFILLLYGLIFAYEQVMTSAHVEGFVPIDKFFKIGLGIAVMTSIGAIMVQINADRRLRKIENKIYSGNQTELSDLIKQEIKKQVESELAKHKERNS